MEIQSTYQRTLKFAASKHGQIGQLVPGTNLPYVVHLSNVAMEILTAFSANGDFDLNYALTLALLHDTIEDTETTYEEILTEFGAEVAQGVLALTKDDSLLKEERMPDSLSRIRLLTKEVGAVKLADRITNLQPPPGHWDNIKKTAYVDEARQILEALMGVNEYLERRLEKKIEEYKQYI